jgi:hypothetical protein
MKKLVLKSLLAILFTVAMNAQKKTIDVSSIKIGQISGKYSKVIDLEKNDTLSYVYLGFQNFKYRTISDTRSVFFAKQEDLKSFVEDLKAALPEIGSKQNIDWKRQLYSISVYDFSSSLYLFERPSKGDGHTIISKKELEKLISWLETIQIGK